MFTSLPATGGTLRKSRILTNSLMKPPSDISHLTFMCKERFAVHRSFLYHFYVNVMWTLLKMMVSSSLSSPLFTWAQQFFKNISYQLLYPCVQDSALYNLAGCFSLHHQELKPPRGPYSSNVSQTAIKQQSVCEAEWRSLKSLPFTKMLIASDDDKGFWQPAQTQQRDNTHAINQISERAETWSVLFVFDDRKMAHRYLKCEQSVQRNNCVGFALLTLLLFSV